MPRCSRSCRGENVAGEIHCWEFGDTYFTAGLVSDADLLDFSASNTRQCQVTVAGATQCWESGEPEDVAGLPGNVVQVSVGLDHTCAITDTGDAKCWGANHEGQVGHRDSRDSYPNPADVYRMRSGATQILAGPRGTCALIIDGTVKCWGRAYRFSRIRDVVPASRPFEVEGLSAPAQKLALGDVACAIVETGGVECWGQSDSAQLGGGGRFSSAVPVAPAVEGDIIVQPAALDFGDVVTGRRATETITVSNAGSDSLLIGETRDGYPAAPFRVTDDQCSGRLLRIDQSCELTLAFAPEDEGEKTGALSIESDDPDTQRLDISLRGAGTASLPPEPPSDGGDDDGGSVGGGGGGGADPWPLLVLALLVAARLRGSCTHRLEK